MSIVHCSDCGQSFDSDFDEGLVIGEKWICTPCKEYAFCNRQLMKEAGLVIKHLEKHGFVSTAKVMQKLYDQSVSQNELLVEMHECIQQTHECIQQTEEELVLNMIKQIKRFRL
jgi:hypothetical protein